jgi:ABC-type lipoprotein release transport system permease subunit
MFLVRLSWRNLWRNRRRTLLTMSAMGFATAVVVLTLGIYEGMFQDMIEGATLYQGQVKIQAKGYYANPRTDLTIPEGNVRETLLADGEVRGAAGRVRSFALLSTGEGDSSSTQPAEILGIDPAEEKGVSGFDRRVVSGRFLDGSGAKDMVLGKSLALRLDVRPGGQVVLMGQDVYGSIAADIFRIAGVVDTGDPVRDSSLALVERRTLQNLLVLEGNVHEWVVTLRHPNAALVFSERMGKRFAGDEVMPWNQFLPQLNDLLGLTKVTKFIFALIFYFAVILVTMNTMYMALIERMSEFAVMNALGLRPLRLSVMVVLEALFMSSIAAFAGGLAGSLAGWYLQAHPIDLSRFIETITYAESTIQPRIRVWMTPSNIAVPVCMLVMFGVLVALFPALRLKNIRPVAVLREV